MTLPLTPQLVEIALTKIEGTAFERFARQYCASIFGENFIPLGGYHDGGADAFDDPPLQGEVSVTSFYQFTTQEDHRSKIRKTIKRLIEVGRKVRRLTYVTSRIVPFSDKDEAVLGDELDADIRIRDGNWIAANLDKSVATRAAAENYLLPVLGFLGTVGAAGSVRSVQNIPAAVCVFLSQECDRRRNKTQLLEAVGDTLILWALDETDPDTGKLLTREEIKHKIIEAMPSAKNDAPVNCRREQRRHLSPHKSSSEFSNEG